MTMLDIIKDLHPIRSGVVCSGADRTIQRFLDDLNGLQTHVHEFESGDSINGWTVPHAWECQKATIHDAAGNLLYDGNAHPLGVCAYSEPFIAGIGGAELKRHLYYDERFHDGLIYHCDWLYKPHIKDWGIVVPKTLYDSIGDREAFHIELRTTKTPGFMKVLEVVLPGQGSDSIVINANNCHPGCSNDDLSGCAVGIEVMRSLSYLPRRRFTYRLIIAPEHYGSIFWLKRFGSAHVKAALFLESVGSDGPLVNQQSFDPHSPINRALTNSLPDPSRAVPFRSLVGNDETCWEACGIPCPSLSRCPFPEYHSDRDSPAIMSQASLAQAVQVVVRTLDVMEHHDTYPIRRFNGLVALSNPAYDLYKPMMDPSIPGRRSITPEARRFNSLMDALPQLMSGAHSVLDIVERYSLRFREVLEYLKQWESKGLIEMRQGPVDLPQAPVSLHGMPH